MDRALVLLGAALVVFGVYKFWDRQSGLTLVEVSYNHPTKTVHIPRSRINKIAREIYK